MLNVPSHTQKRNGTSFHEEAGTVIVNNLSVDVCVIYIYVYTNASRFTLTSVNCCSLKNKIREEPKT